MDKISKVSTQVKRVLVIQDLSGFGHTSLMAAIPLYYRLGIRVCAFPTAVLSANTDFPDYRWADMSSHLDGFAAHWKKLGLRFDAIQTGFLSSPEQALQVNRAIYLLRDDATVVMVDPVLGDHGALYGCFDARMALAMRGLVSSADIITPNFTEAALLLGEDPVPKRRDSEVWAWCERLAELGPGEVVVTSVPGLIPSRLAVITHNREFEVGNVFTYVPQKGVFPGAGDCFSALVLAGVVNGFGCHNSVSAAVNIMSRAIQAGLPDPALWREGIWLEEVLRWDLAGFYTISE